MSGNRSTNRGDHLKNLARVFRRRGCDWADLGQFLHWLFYDQDSPHHLSNLNCRHDPSGLGHSYNGSRPCTTAGTRDKGKTMKFVSFDLRILAREWCSENGFQLTGGGRPSLMRRASACSRSRGRGSASGNDLIDSTAPGDDDTWAKNLGSGTLSFGSSSPLHSSQEEGERRSTGLRVHILAFLCNYWDDPVQLEGQWNALVTTQTPLLHFCGCGVCHNQDRACTEPSHLRLGTREENDYQTGWHQLLTTCQDRTEYLWLCRFLNQRQGVTGGDVI